MRTVFFALLLVLALACEKTDGSNKPKKLGIPCVVQRVTDGDTFTCLLDGKEEVKVRLIGIDAPESRINERAVRQSQQTGIETQEIVKMGQRAKNFVKEIITKGTEVYLEFDVQRTDRYGRLLAYVWLRDGRMLNELILREGYAQVYTVPPNVKYQERFLSAQRYARENMKGLWKEGFR